MRKITAFAGFLTAACLFGAAPTSATYYGGGPWCLRYDIGNGTNRENCEMPSFEACAQERFNWGTTASCTQNPGFAGYSPAPAGKKKKKRHYQ